MNMNIKELEKLDIGVRRLVDWQFSRSGGFVKTLFELIAIADDDNKELLKKGFPLEVEAHENFSLKIGWWEELCKKLNVDI